MLYEYNLARYFDRSPAFRSPGMPQGPTSPLTPLPPCRYAPEGEETAQRNGGPLTGNGSGGDRARMALDSR